MITMMVCVMGMVMMITIIGNYDDTYEDDDYIEGETKIIMSAEDDRVDHSTDKDTSNNDGEVDGDDGVDDDDDNDKRS